MSEPTDIPSQDEEGGQRIDVRRLSASNGMTPRQIVRAARAALGDRSASLSIAIVDDERIASLHERYMNDPTPTDVLTFDLRDEPDASPVEGEIVVSAETAQRQATELSVDPGEELLRYVVHGVLHLTGYDDGTPARRRQMRRAENRILTAINSANTQVTAKRRKGRIS